MTNKLQEIRERLEKAEKEREAYHRPLISLSMALGNPVLAPDMGRTFSEELVNVAIKRWEAAESRLLLAEKLAEAVKGLIEMGESSEYARFWIPPGSDENSEPIIEGRSALSAWEGK